MYNYLYEALDSAVEALGTDHKGQAYADGDMAAWFLLLLAEAEACF